MNKTTFEKVDRYYRENPVRIIMSSNERERAEQLKTLRLWGFTRFTGSSAECQEMLDKANYIGIGVRKGDQVGRLVSWASERVDCIPYMTWEKFVQDYNELLERLATLKGVANMSNVTKPDTNIMQDVANQLRPYKKYILAAAVLLCIDHFFLKGEVRHRIIAIVRKVSDKIIKLLEAGADTILGDEKPNTPPAP
jgi:hypothetical protein